jgi:hypothetical protein
VSTDGPETTTASTEPPGPAEGVADPEPGTDAEPDEPEQPSGAEDDPEAQLRALRNENAHHRRKARQAQKRVDEVEAERDDLKRRLAEVVEQNSATLDEARAEALEQGRAEGEAAGGRIHMQALARAQARALAMEAGARGAPLDAVSDLVLSRVPVEDGSDRQAVLDALEAEVEGLRESTPELFRQSRPPVPRIEQGPRNGPSRAGSGDWLRDAIHRGRG